MKTFEAGETGVRAKWPGSSLWYKATIKKVLEDGYSVIFEDGTEYDLDFNEVAPEGRFQRRRSRSSSRSPGRRRSRSRSPARRAAPMQKKTPSPSPSRTTRRPVTREATSVTKRTAVTTRRSTTEPKTSTPLEITQVRALPKRTITPTVTRTSEHRTYTTRSTTKSGQHNLEPPSEVTSRFVPRTRSYDFGGPIGTFLLIFLLPLIVYHLYFSCTEDKCKLVLLPKIETNWRKYLNLNAFLLVVGWILFQLFIYFVPIGRIVQGMPLRTGRRLRYYENAFWALFLTLFTFGLLKYYKTSFDIMLDNYLALITAAMILSVLLSIYLYVRSKYAPPSALAPHGNSGNFFYDFFMGHELNPRIGMLDLKYFFELRPGLIGWVVLDLVFLFAKWENFPSGNPPVPLLLLTIFHTIYVADALWYETSILSTMDIITEGFGYMLAFGDLVWVPFVFTVQARFLFFQAVTMPSYCFGIIVAMNLLGYYIFRSANNQKNLFRKNPNSLVLANLETIKTSSGKRLLVSGWWGFVRRPNYLGDIIMAFSWALLCGVHSFIPFVYPTYLTIVLIFRERRDSRYCQQKYGSDWDAYCRRVKYRIIPYVY